MPNPESIRKAAEKRAQRKASREDNVKAAEQQAQQTAILTQLQKAAKTDPKAAAELREMQPPKPVVKAISKKEKQIAARKAAEAQADADARVVPKIDEAALDLSYYRDRGIDPPLSVLNAIAKRNDATIRNDARDLARAVAETAYEQVTTRDARGRHSRERRMQRAIAEQEANKAKAAAGATQE